MGFTKYTSQAEKERVRMNEGIRAKELRVLGPEGENYGVMQTKDALEKASSLGYDLIEISPNANPPVARIADYGRFKYEQKKKDKEVKSKVHVSETKTTQVKIGTSEHDMHLKASKSGAWLREGHRVKIDLFLWGRYKYMDFDFLKERLERFLGAIVGFGALVPLPDFEICSCQCLLLDDRIHRKQRVDLLDPGQRGLGIGMRSPGDLQPGEAEHV